MTRLLPAVVATFLMLLFLAINQAIISNQASKNIATLPNAGTDGAPVSKAVPIDNDQRGAHSYFLPARIFSARHNTIAASQSNETQVNFVNSSNTVQPITPRANAQDLLRSGYLRDNEASYMPDFGVARSK